MEKTKGIQNQPLTEWITEVTNKTKPIMLYWLNGTPIVARANLKSLKAWMVSATVVKDPKKLKVHKSFDIPNDSYQVYVME